MKDQKVQLAIQSIINHTNERIKKWYENVKVEYGVTGAGKAHYNKSENEVVVEYTEDGVQSTWRMAFYPEYIENGINWVFDCWSELA